MLCKQHEVQVDDLLGIIQCFQVYTSLAGYLINLEIRLTVEETGRVPFCYETNYST
jgi:hypothetical protein